MIPTLKLSNEVRYAIHIRLEGLRRHRLGNVQENDFIGAGGRRAKYAACENDQEREE